ncbi:MAG: ABC transporter permease [Deltaproteobacteria bacterium]|nr:ABC transporter permease [Deltaproteobacteria bacterium]
MLSSTLVMALREIRRNTMRSVLTTLGIVIGVAAVIIMVTVGEGATAKVTADVAKLGNNMLTLLPGAHRHGPAAAAAAPFTLADVQAIRREVPAVAHVAPSANRGVLAVAGNKNHNTVATGATNEYLSVRQLALELGRSFSDVELLGGAPACLLGATVRKELFGATDPLGTAIRVGNLSCQVVGVIASKGQSTFGADQDDFLLLPLATFQRRLAGNTDVGAIALSAADDRSIPKVKQQLTLLMRERRHIAEGQSDDFWVMDTKEILATLSTVAATLTALLGAIAGVSLLVGGIGIMNIMLVSVTERTREIGIRLAIGARGREVLWQFLVEAVVLSLLGGVLGMLLGLGGALGATRGLDFPFVLSPLVVVVAFGFSAAVGVAFGFFPARKAARLNPIEALRHE